MPFDYPEKDISPGKKKWKILNKSVWMPQIGLQLNLKIFIQDEPPFYQSELIIKLYRINGTFSEVINSNSTCAGHPNPDEEWYYHQEAYK